MTVSLDLKSTRLEALLLPLRGRDLPGLLAAAAAQWAGAFEGEPLVLDARELPTEGPSLDWVGLIRGLQEQRLQPVALLGAERLQAAERAAALAAGLHFTADAPSRPPPPPSPAPAMTTSHCLLIDRPLRSGQQVYARDADLIVLGLVSHGAEVIADGHVHVYGALRGRAIAGAKGRSDARIFAQSLEAELLAVAGTFRTSEKPLPPEVAGRPAQVRLHQDGEHTRLVFEPLKY